MGTAEVVAGAGYLIRGLRIALEARAVWDEFERALIARQQQRAAEGTMLTLEDLRELIAATGAKIEANHAELERLAALQAASQSAG